MNRMSLRLFVLMLLALSWQALPGAAHAGTSDVSCTAIVKPVNFNTINPNGSGNATATGYVQFTCTNTGIFQQGVTLCIGLGAGNVTGSSITNRKMNIPSAPSSTLSFQVYTDSSSGSPIWGNVPSSSNPPPLTPLRFQIASGWFGSGRYSSPSYPIYGILPTPQAGAVTGDYLSNLNGSLTYQSNDEFLNTSYPTNCDSGGSNAFTLTTQARVDAQCTVTAGPTLNLGNPAGVDATLTNINGSNSIDVTCTNGTPYFVGLAPSNNSTTGAGLMAGSGSNSDKIPYQLRSTPGMAGTIWGNTATSTSVGNGVAGTGNGNSQLLTVYATTPSADFTPDTYTDVVTINVNY